MCALQCSTEASAQTVDRAVTEHRSAGHDRGRLLHRKRGGHRDADNALATWEKDSPFRSLFRTALIPQIRGSFSPSTAPDRVSAQQG